MHNPIKPDAPASRELAATAFLTTGLTLAAMAAMTAIIVGLIDYASHHLIVIMFRGVAS